MTNQSNAVTQHLINLQDPAYKRFQQNLIPTVAPEAVLGVRIPQIRKYAKELAHTPEAHRFLNTLPHRFYDENNLHGALLEQIRDFDAAIEAVERFLPYIDNWATCDSFCPKILKSQPERLWQRIGYWLASDQIYTVRYGLVRLTAWYLDAPLFSCEVLDAAAAVKHEDYYVRMAQAWLFSVALVKRYDATLPYLSRHRLSPWVHNKAIQKAIESYRIDADTKTFLKTLKREL